MRCIVAIALVLGAACGGGAAKYSYGPTAQARAAGGGDAEAVAMDAPSSSGGGGGGAVVASNTSAVAETTKLPEQLVIEGWIGMKVDDVPAATAAIRADVEGRGGRVISENVTGSSESWNAYIKLRLPPAEVPGFLASLDGRGEITRKQIQGTDVSRTLYDYEIRLQNLQLTLERLRKLLESEGLKMEDILAIEREMTRLRGEIEQIKGEQRWLQDRVALATIEIQLTSSEGVLMSPKVKVYPGPRFASLILLNKEGRDRVRFGGGATMHIGIPRVSLELDVFEDADGTGKAVLATFGGAFYSDFLGRGRRRFLNPYLGFRLGYGYLEASKFAVAAEAGVELFKHKYLLVDANIRAVGLIGDSSDAALVAGAGFVFAF